MILNFYLIKFNLTILTNFDILNIIIFYNIFQDNNIIELKFFIVYIYILSKLFTF